MSKITTVAEIRPLVMAQLSAAPDLNILDMEIRNSIVAFFVKSKAWREWLTPVVSVDWQQDYTIPNPYDASIDRISNLLVNEKEVDRSKYSLYQSTFLRFQTPQDPTYLSEMVLECGSTGTTTIATWKAIADPAFAIDIDGSILQINWTGTPFQSITSLSDVARLLETAVRQELDDSRFYCVFDGVNFVMRVSDGEIGYLSAPATGTNISGATYLNGLTGGTGVSVGGCIRIEAVFRPDHNIATFPSWLMDRWVDAIIHLTCYNLKRQGGKPWTELQMLSLHKSEYEGQLGLALSEQKGEFNDSVRYVEA